MDFFWMLIEYICCLCEPVFAFVLFSHHLGASGKRRTAAIILIPIMAAATFILNRLNAPLYVVSLLFLIEISAYSLFLFNGTKANRLLWGAMPSIIFVIADHTVVSIMMLVTSRWQEAIIPANGLRAIGISLYVLLLAITLIILVIIRRQEGELPLFFTLAPILLAALGIVSILIHEAQYEKLSEAGLDVFPCALTNITISILCAASALLLHFASVFYKRNIDSQKELQYRKLEADHIEQIGSMYEYIREWRHDMSGLLSTVDSLARDGNIDGIHGLIVGIDAAAKETAVIINSGNPAIDATISGKLMAAKEAGIRVNCTIAIPSGINIDQTDICSVLINLLDNAIRAARELEEERRSIDLAVSSEGNMLKISVKNPCNGEYVFSGSELLSTKEHSLDHGIGLKRIKRIVEKHDGFTEFHPNKNSFEAIVLLRTEGEK